MCGWSAGSTCLHSCGSWKQFAKGKFTFGVRLKSLFVNSKVQRLWENKGEWGAGTSNQMWLHENTNSRLLLGLGSPLTPSHTAGLGEKEHEREIWHKRIFLTSVDQLRVKRKVSQCRGTNKRIKCLIKQLAAIIHETSLKGIKPKY